MLDVEVLAEADAPGGSGRAVEPSERTDAGLVAIGSDDEARLNGVAVGVNDARSVGRGFDTADYCLPVKTDSESSSAIEE